MKKTVNINLAGTFFHIDEDAFLKLNRYLDAIKKSFEDPNSSDEIIRDIEARIAELFSEKVENKSQVISLKELDDVIAVMGQPEDYIIDEEIFEETPISEKKNKKYSSNYKQLFRDIDNKFVAGVSSGLGHYFGIDALLIRLIWILFIFLGWGSPVLIYLLLWILVPAAESTSDKLKMTNKAVNISNIEKKIKEEVNQAAESIKNTDYKKYGNQAKKGATTFFGSLGSVLMTLLKIVGKFIGILLIIISITTIIALIIGLCTTGASKVVWGNAEVFDYITIVNTTNTPLWLVALLIFFAFAIPFFVLLILGLKMLVSNLKSIGTPAKITLFVIWLVSIIALAVIGIRQAVEQGYDGEVIIEKNLPISSNDTLKIAMVANKNYEYKVRRSGNFEIKYNDANEKLIYSNDIRLIVRSTSDSIAKIVIEKKAEGKSFLNAKETAQAINYNYSINNNNLSLDGYFTTDVSNKYRNQEIEIIVYLPEGTVLYADNNTYSFHRNYSRYNDILNNGDEDHYLKIIKNKTVCLDCPIPETQTNNNIETTSEDWEREVHNSNYNKKHNNNHIQLDEDGVNIKTENGSHIKIDENGVDIKIREEN
ncbi:MAG: PspC domain-containing protein [Flavobacteriales bacterium]